MKQFTLITLIILMMGCSGGKQESTPPPPSFPTPPATYTTPTLRASYIMDEVWAPYQQLDTALFGGQDATEQFLVNYFAIGEVATPASFQTSVEQLLSISDSTLTQQLLSFAQNYLQHRHSPIYNMDSYVVVMDQMEAKGLLTEAESIRYQDERQLWSRNQVGSLSSNFQFLTPQGGTKELHQIATNHLLLLIFYNPGCYSCTSAFEYIKSSTPLQEAIKDKRVTLLCVNPLGSEENWRATLNELPQGALAGYDTGQTIINQSLYDLNAAPAVYLLDNQHNVLLKNASLEGVEEYITQHP